MAPPSQELEPPINPGRFTVAQPVLPQSAYEIIKTPTADLVVNQEDFGPLIKRA
jgi:hypothetical protein